MSNFMTSFLYTVLIISIGVVIYLNISSICKILYAYIRKEADLRACLMAQASMFFFIFAIETLYFLITGRMNQFCLCSCKIFYLVVGFLFVCSKFIGKPSINISSSIKNMTFVLTCTLFYACIIFTSVFLIQSPFILVRDTESWSFERLALLSSALRWNCFLADGYNFILIKDYYIIVPSIFFMMALIFDLIEKEQKKILIIDYIMLLGITLNILINKDVIKIYSQTQIFVDLLFIFAMFVIPMACISIQSNEIYKNAVENANITLLKKVFKSYKKGSEKAFYESQRPIAKKIIKNKDDKNLQRELKKRKYKKFLSDLS